MRYSNPEPADHPRFVTLSYVGQDGSQRLTLWNRQDYIVAFNGAGFHLIDEKVLPNTEVLLREHWHKMKQGYPVDMPRYRRVTFRQGAHT